MIGFTSLSTKSFIENPRNIWLKIQVIEQKDKKQQTNIWIMKLNS